MCSARLYHWSPTSKALRRFKMIQQQLKKQNVKAPVEKSTQVKPMNEGRKPPTTSKSIAQNWVLSVQLDINDVLGESDLSAAILEEHTRIMSLISRDGPPLQVVKNTDHKK